ncbi:MAG TPA: hypothetical protein VMB34_24535 [Acetobacteraceae bacterium]|nr:hypothetical protein [Acetobacteraceae bacterium]
MELRKFAIGDQVRLILDSYATNNPADVYSVSRVLPLTANVWQYRVKRLVDGQERAVSEPQLVSVRNSTNRSAIRNPTSESIRDAHAPLNERQ